MDLTVREELLEEERKLKRERVRIKKMLKAWASGSGEMYDERGMRKE